MTDARVEQIARLQNIIADADADSGEFFVTQSQLVELDMREVEAFEKAMIARAEELGATMMVRREPFTGSWRFSWKLAG